VTSAAVTSGRETPAFVDTGTDTIFGVLTEPAGEPRGTAVIVVPATAPSSAGFGRENVYLCRRLAARGYHTFRFDYHGAGDSTGMVDRISLGRLFKEDVDAVVRWFRARGIEDFILVGSCFGSRTAMAYAADQPPTRMLALVAPPVRDFELGQRTHTAQAMRMSTGQAVKRMARPTFFRNVLFNPRLRRRYRAMARARFRSLIGRLRHREAEANDHWVSPRFLEVTRAVMQRRVPTLLLYGDADEFWADFERARPGRLGRILQAWGTGVEVRTLSGTLHDYRDQTAQRAMQDLIGEWILRSDHGRPAEVRARTSAT